MSTVPPGVTVGGLVRVKVNIPNDLRMETPSAEISTTPLAPPITAGDLDVRWLVRRLPGRNRTKADLLHYRAPRGEFALKDYRPRSWIVRNVIGRRLVRRELRAYEAAAGIPGLPRCFGRQGPFALAIEWIPARPLAKFGVGEIAPERFDRLAEVLAGLHAAGVALADLSHRDVLLGEDGSVHVVDLAAACVLGARPGRIRRRLFEHFSASDRFAVARLRTRYLGEEPSVALAGADPTVLAWHRRARRLKWTWDKLRGAPRLPPVDDHWRF